MAEDKPVLLDCTLRDGGYYTNWTFDDDLVRDYLATCTSIGIDVVELGYVRLRGGGKGPYGNLPDRLPADLDKAMEHGTPPRFAAMIDAKEFVSADGGVVDARAATAAIRSRVGKSALDIETIRVAVAHAQLSTAVGLIEALVDEGIKVCVNIMQIDLASADDVRRCLDILAALPPVEAVYIADSFGSMRPERVASLISRLCAGLACPIGFHAHDNKGLALHNTLIAASAGATWLDMTMCGMGRGAGNAKTEQIVPLFSRDLAGPAVDRLQRLVASRFVPLQRQYGWGSSIFYDIAASAKIHPSFVQEINANQKVDDRGRIGILRELSKIDASSYSLQKLTDAVGTYVD